jgi:hypothetical protein
VQKLYPSATPGSIQVGPPFKKVVDLEKWSTCVHLECRISMSAMANMTVKTLLEQQETEVVNKMAKRYINLAADEMVKYLWSRSKDPLHLNVSESTFRQAISDAHDALDHNELLYLFFPPTYSKQIAPEFNFDKRLLRSLELSNQAQLINTFNCINHHALIIPAEKFSLRVKSNSEPTMDNDIDDLSVRIIKLDLVFEFAAEKGNWLAYTLSE